MKWIKPLAQPRFIHLFAGLAIICLAAFLFLYQALAARGVPTTLDMMTGFTPAQARAHFSLYSADAFALLNWFQVFDVIFPAAYGLLFASFSAWLLGRLSPNASRLLWLGAVPLAGAFCDLFENSGIFIMARTYPGDIETAAALTSLAGVVKDLLFAGSLLMLVALTFIFLVRRARNKHIAAAE